MASKEVEDAISIEHIEQFHEQVFEYLGKNWRWLRKISWLCLPTIFPGLLVMSYSFTGVIPDHRCFVNGCDGFTPDMKANSNDTSQKLENQFVNCIPNVETNNSFRCDISGDIRNLTEKCEKWIFDTSMFSSTVATEFNLVCENEWMHTVGSSSFMFGMLIGDSIVGRTGDLYGRRITYITSAIIAATASTASAFSSTFTSFCILRFFSGVGACGLFLSVFVWGVENVGKKQRIIVGCLFQLLFTTGASIVGVLSYFIRSWRTLQLAISIPIFALIPLAWLVPESPRWLVIQKRYKKAREILLASINNDEKGNKLRKLLEPFARQRLKQRKIKKEVIYTIERPEALKAPTKSTGISGILSSYALVKRLVSLLFVWLTCMLCYYGLTFAASSLSSNFYLNYQLLVLIEIPAYVCSMLLMENAGRRITLGGCFLMSGVFCLATGLVAENMVGKTACALTGKLFITGVFATMYSFTSELFPTAVRGTITGLCSTFGRTGGILAPVILSMERYVDWYFPFICFGILNVLSGILSLTLPETKGESLPSTVKEAIQLSGKHPLLTCKKQIYPKEGRIIDYQVEEDFERRKF